MGKRKADNKDFIVENEDSKPFKRTQKQKKNIIKEESESDYNNNVKSEDEDEVEVEVDELEDEPLAKKPKTEMAKTAAKQSDVSSNEILVKITGEGDKYVELGKKKRVTVRSFKGTPLIDIREFYGSDGDEKPGKKGISLTLDQWETLKKSADTLDELFATVKKK